MRTARAVLAMAALATLGACATPSAPAASTSAAPASLVDGTSVAALAASGTVRIGVKTDSPGLGYLPTGAPSGTAPAGFDIEIAKLIAGGLDIEPGQIQWVAVNSFDRESSLTDGKVDLVVASYSMTAERAAVVGQAGPYYMTGQQIMVRDDSDIVSIDDVKDKSVCSVPGSPSGDRVVDKGAVSKAYTSYSACVDALLAGELDIVSTDGAILSGFVEEHPDDLTIVGEPFTTERYGIGYPRGDRAMCVFLRESLLRSYSDGSWKTAYESTLGKSGIEAPVPPRPDECPTG